MDFIKLFLSIALVLFAIVGALVAVAGGLTWYGCASYGKATGNEVKYQGFTCYGKIDGKWYSSDEYNKIYTAKRFKIEQ